MKKKLFLSVFLILFSVPLFSRETSQAKIQNLQGDVQVFEKEGASAKKAEADMPIVPSNIIATGPQAFCVVQLDQDNSFRIKQNTRVKVEKIWEESQKLDGSVVSQARLGLMRGELTAKLDKLPKNGKFEVSSPVAIAGASGTVYTVEVAPEGSKTSVTVLDHQVEVISTQEPAKSVRVEKFQRVETAPWSETKISALGRAVLSEAILGKSFVKDAETNIQIQAVGAGSSQEAAKLQAFYKLSKIILNLHVDQEKTLESAMAKDQSLTQKIYGTISSAQILSSAQSPDGNFQVKAQINLQLLTQALGRPLYGMTQSVIPMTSAEYSSKFGALARVTTQRAAQIEGCRNLAEIIYGTVINSNTTVEDFALKNDTIRTSVRGLVKGAKMIETQYFSDGSIIVSLEIRGTAVPENLGSVTGDVFGKNYLSGPQLIEYREFEDTTY